MNFGIKKNYKIGGSKVVEEEIMENFLSINEQNASPTERQIFF